MWFSTADEEIVPEEKEANSSCAFDLDSTHYRNLFIITSSEYKTIIDPSHAPLKVPAA